MTKPEMPRPTPAICRQIEREHPHESDAEKWRLAVAQALLEACEQAIGHPPATMQETRRLVRRDDWPRPRGIPGDHRYYRCRSQ
jgi:hypothetical protein